MRPLDDLTSQRQQSLRCEGTRTTTNRQGWRVASCSVEVGWQSSRRRLLRGSEELVHVDLDPPVRDLTVKHRVDLDAGEG